MIACLMLTGCGCKRVGKVQNTSQIEGATICTSTTTKITMTTTTTTAEITSTTTLTTIPTIAETTDAILLAQVINKEASATYEGKVAVASVIWNRSIYTNQTIPEVIFEPNQFSVVDNLGDYTEEDYQAAIEVLDKGSVNEAYYFDGCHEDGLNWFYDFNHNFIGAW